MGQEIWYSNTLIDGTPKLAPTTFCTDNYMSYEDAECALICMLDWVLEHENTVKPVHWRAFPDVVLLQDWSIRDTLYRGRARLYLQ